MSRVVGDKLDGELAVLKGSGSTFRCAGEPWSLLLDLLHRILRSTLASRRSLIIPDLQYIFPCYVPGTRTKRGVGICANGAFMEMIFATGQVDDS
jgi:hypothetical protein